MLGRSAAARSGRTSILAYVTFLSSGPFRTEEPYVPLVVRNTPRTDLAVAEGLAHAGVAEVCEAQGRSGLPRAHSLRVAVDLALAM